MNNILFIKTKVIDLLLQIRKKNHLHLLTKYYYKIYQSNNTKVNKKIAAIFKSPQY